MNEIWKDVKGYEGLYQISNLGNVKSLDRYIEKFAFDKKIKMKSKSKQLKIRRNEIDYLSVILSKDGVCKGFGLAKLVAEHFIDNPDNCKCVNYKDGNKLNCAADNLEWGKHSVNTTLNKRVKISKDDFVKEFSSKKECCDFFGCTHTVLNYNRKLFGNKFKFRGYFVELN